ncbi:MoxR-like ATPase [Mycolicibacterium phlei]|jgi:MoxR-like ATPase|uniref:ATPase AAA n=2 Tax=Mycolicibacterium TaxID=1866885 RepID=A0A5N5VC59_MYCPH|nr:AAA family ATPase [Mycolicibacterium phlei]VEG11718.1 MoxR-like ATPase [Mycobacteroides chelonae]AMO63624.1 ATPase family associated with various cellular activities (AAA) [Mycolicibacterium phlei]EID12837.1 MoxR-like ATPase [Mycolicibacterium phlei RIVM601174]KAB7759542.1 ATPase AAA [Mycolicibacterium phlei DSM 43239 = CCUG 21000]KXW60162.1 ATPase AAA [Mycolicibacterium phlei DSM 43072]
MQLSGPQLSQEDLRRAGEALGHLKSALSAKIVGQTTLQQSLLIGLLTSGHILLESVPGLAKTTAAKTLADSIDARFQRIQCTPDLLPSDITGGQIWDQKNGEFKVSFGPVHANIVLLDEINRSSAKTQSAMLEAMEERQTTIGGEVYPLPDPFLVLATQNPIDQEGTYQLSEAQMDRFMLKDILTYPTPEEEEEVVVRVAAGVFDTDSRPATNGVLDTRQVLWLQNTLKQVFIDRSIVKYATYLVNTTRNPRLVLEPRLADLVQYGASPRATIALCKAACAHAFLNGRPYTVPDDVKSVAVRVLRHRILLKFQASAEGVTPEYLIEGILHRVPTP